jgi:hypothetical protein
VQDTFEFRFPLWRGSGCLCIKRGGRVSSKGGVGMDDAIQRASLQRGVESLVIKMIGNRQSDSVCVGNRIYFLNRSI